MIWSQSLFGRAIDMVHPRVDQVDFEEIALMMARVYRWSGSATRDTSIAEHTLAGLDFCERDVAPYWVLHDTPETRIGDKTRPTQAAHATVAREMFGVILANCTEAFNTVSAAAATIVRDSWDELDRRHATVIHIAAGLAMPDAAMCARVKEIDDRVLMFERRERMVKEPRRWDERLEEIAERDKHRASPAILVQQRQQFAIAAAMHEAFLNHLPVFNRPQVAGATQEEVNVQA